MAVSKIPPFDEQNVIDSRGYGVVYKAKWNNEEVAIKRVLLNHMVIKQQEEALLTLIHPNIVKLIYLEDDKDFRHYVSELCKASLEKLFLKDGDPKKYSWPIPSKIEVLIQLATGLEYIHKKGIVHRDIKPENVFICVRDDRKVLMKWADFGLSKRVTESGTYLMSGFTGAMKWIAPEILKLLEEGDANDSIDTLVHQRATIKSDIYATGLVFAYFLSGGHHPFGSDVNVIYNMTSSKLDKTHVEKIESKQLQGIIRSKMLENEPEGRSSALNILSRLNFISEQNDKNKSSFFPLCSKKDFNYEKLQVLLRKGASVHCADPKENTPLLMILKKRNWVGDLIPIVQLMIEQGVDINHKDKEDQNNALHYLCQYFTNENLIVVVGLMIQHGIDINCQNKNGMNALHVLSCYYSNDNLIDIVRLMIQHGIDINCQSKLEWNALHFLCSYYLNDNLIEIIRLMIQHGIDINCQNRNGSSALHVLCRCYSKGNLIDIVRLMIQHGIIISFQNKDGWNALHILCRYMANLNLTDIVRLLIQHGIDINCQNKDGLNALHILCRYYSNDNLIDVVRLMVQHGISVNCKTNEGINALHFLCCNYSNDNLIDIVHLLIKHGIDINCQDNDGLNALNYLCRHFANDNLIDIVRILIQHGMDFKNGNFENTLGDLCNSYKGKNLEDILILIREAINISLERSAVDEG